MLDARFANVDDLRFVRDSWFESFRRGGFAPEIGFDLFQDGQRNLIAYLTERPFHQVLVAYAENQPDEILGWLCFEKDTIHFLYVKSTYRKMGIAKGLVDYASVTFKFYTHQTRAGIQLAKKYALRYNPFLTQKGNGP